MATKVAKKAVKKSSGRGAGILKKNICFKGCETTLEELMGKKPVAAADMVKAMWAYVKEHDLQIK